MLQGGLNPKLKLGLKQLKSNGQPNNINCLILIICRIEDLMKIIGKKTIVTEKVKKESKTKNTLTQLIVRKSVEAIVLECGHSIPVTEFNKVPTKNTYCKICKS